MATFEDHITQANSNLSFLSLINQQKQTFWDWQVTVAFYVAVHIANSHISKKANLQYRTHEDVKNALNPYNSLSICRIPEAPYLCYTKLEGLSRRSRYLCNEKNGNRSNDAHLTYEKHLAKAIRHLDCVLSYFGDLYGIKFNVIKITCQDISKSDNLKYFII